MGFGKTLITNLFELKKYAGYSAERQIGLLLSIWLAEIFPGYELVAPEFPLKKQENSKRSIKIDFLLYSSKEKKIRLLELKTDSSTFKIEQMEDLLQYNNWEKIVKGLKDIIMNNKSGNKKKYLKFRDKLIDFGLVNGDNIEGKSGLSVELCYLVPANLKNKIKSSNENIIITTFNEIPEAKVINKFRNEYEFLREELLKI
jgi:hypothetical protein